MHDRSPHPTPPTAYHGANPVGGRDFVAGDLHGELDTLEQALNSLEFRPARDRLFTVGDLIDRGPRSADALEWLARGRFAGGVRGNHEQMMLNACLAGEHRTYDEDGPGALWYDSDHEANDPHGHLVDRACDAIEMLPYLTTIEYGARRIGLVHAPGATDHWHEWERITQWAELVCRQERFQATPKGHVLQHDLLWRAAATNAESADDPKLHPRLEGVDLVLTGHTPALHPIWTRANVLCLDTGVHYEALGHLTIAQIEDGLELHRFPRVERFDKPGQKNAGDHR